MKSVCDFLLVNNSNLDPISQRFRDMASFPLKMLIFSTPSIQPQIWKYSSWTASRNFVCKEPRHRANYLHQKFPL